MVRRVAITPTTRKDARQQTHHTFLKSSVTSLFLFYVFENPPTPRVISYATELDGITDKTVDAVICDRAAEQTHSSALTDLMWLVSTALVGAVCQTHWPLTLSIQTSHWQQVGQD